jgi:hypothetical protein
MRRAAGRKLVPRRFVQTLFRAEMQMKSSRWPALKMSQPTAATEADGGCSAEICENERQLRTLRKKLRQIEKIETKVAGSEPLSEEELLKASKKTEIEKAIIRLARENEEMLRAKTLLIVGMCGESIRVEWMRNDTVGAIKCRAFEAAQRSVLADNSTRSLVQGEAHSCHATPTTYQSCRRCHHHQRFTSHVAM